MDDKKLLDVINALEETKPETRPEINFATNSFPGVQKKSIAKKLLLALLLVCIGGATLGIGVGAGYAAMLHFLPEENIPYQTTENNEVASLRLTPAAIPINPQDPSFVDIIPQVKDSVVSITVLNRTADRRREAPGSGSGFVFYDDGEYIFIATNNHVVEHAHEINVSLDDYESVPAQIVGLDRYSDLAVLAVPREAFKEKDVPFTVANFGDSDIMRMGESVVAIGNSMGEGQIVTMGIISATNMQITIDDPDMRTVLTLDVMQTDAAVNRGNSGGPLVNHHGEVIGVVTAKLFGANIEGMGYAIPINNAAEILMQLKENGTVRHPWIGIRHWEIMAYRRDMFNLPDTGMLIMEVFPDTPAEEAGLQEHDLIIYYEQTRVQNVYDMRAAMINSRPGDVIVLEIYRNRERMSIEVTLGSIMP